MTKVITWFRELVERKQAVTTPLKEMAEGSESVCSESENKANSDNRPDLSTVPLGPAPYSLSSYQWAYDVGWATDCGLVRDHNEDALYVNLGQQEAAQGAPAFGLFMVSDGMGGHLGGERASMVALRTAATSVISDVYVPLLAGQSRGSDQPSITDVVRKSIQMANNEVTQSIPGSGCTLTFAMLLEERAFIGHVGDSRAYQIEDGKAIRLTRDHSFVNRLIEMGEITPEEAVFHPQRNVLYRAIGQSGNLESQLVTLTLDPGQTLLLCSDGLWNLVDDAEIAEIVSQEPNLFVACQRLVSRANAEGGTDNITVVAFRLTGV